MHIGTTPHYTLTKDHELQCSDIKVTVSVIFRNQNTLERDWA